jgi:hypothetical protein
MFTRELRPKDHKFYVQKVLRFCGITEDELNRKHVNGASQLACAIGKTAACPSGWVN